MNHFNLRELQKAHEEELKRGWRFKEKYQLFEQKSPKHPICIDLKFIKFCL